MARVRFVGNHSVLGTAGASFQLKMVNRMREALKEVGPDEDGNDEVFTMLVDSMQGLQHSHKHNDFLPLIIIRIVQQYDDIEYHGEEQEAVVVVGWAFLSERGVMIDALNPEVQQAMIKAVREVGESEDGLAMTGQRYREGHLAESFTIPPFANAEPTEEDIANMHKMFDEFIQPTEDTNGEES